MSAAALLVAAGLLAVGWVLVELVMLSLAVFAALILTSLLWPIARWLEKRRWPGSLASATALFLALGVFAGAAAWIVPKTISEISSNRDQLKQNAQQLAETVGAKLPGDGAATLRNATEKVPAYIQKNSEKLASGVASGVVTAAEILGALVLALVLAFFFLRDGKKLTRTGLGLLSVEKRRVFGPALRSAWDTLHGWIRGAAIIAFIDAVGIGVGLAILGVPLALPLAILTFFAAFIPVAGATAAGGVAILVAWATGGSTDALITLAIVVGVQQFEGNVLEPMVMGRAVPMHPAAVLLVVTAGALLGGIAGAFAAVPVCAVIIAFVKEVHARSRPAPDQEDAQDEPPPLLEEESTAPH